MKYFYSVGIQTYALLIRLVSNFKPKAKLWIAGRKNLFERIENSIDKSQPYVWFHCASLGEFEQARPVIEEHKIRFPNMRICLTFFSPSGYEIRKNYTGADAIFYLPIDSQSNAKRFLDLVQPQKAFFVKYEFWYFYLNELKKRNIPTYSFSAIFRENQLFFRWYGAWYRKLLQSFTHLFVQNEKSKDLLQSIGIENVTVAGDTRFDRVYTIAQQTRQLPEIERFKDNKTLVVCGSTWQPDEELLIKYINQCSYKFIIAPHEIHTSNIQRIESTLKVKTIRFSQIKDANLADYQVLIIDNVGMLSSIYKYGELAYIGGGFGVGIHNILEAATFGLPIVFGTNYQKFKEAVDLVHAKGAFSIPFFEELKIVIDNLLSDKNLLARSSSVAKNYVEQNRGATNTIMNYELGITINS